VVTRVVEVVADRDRPGAATVRVDGTEQSHVDLGDPTRLEFDYVRRMADVLDTAWPAEEQVRCLHVGGAGMTLARYVATTRPRSRQLVLEPDAELVELVRRELPLPDRSGIRVRSQDGRSGVASLRDGAYDAVVVDAFVGAQVPADLVTVEWYSDVARVAGPAGLVLLNLADRAPFPFVRNALRAVETALPHVVVSAEPATLKGRRHGNVLVVASRSPVDPGPLARRAAGSAFPYRVLDAAAVRDRLSGGRAFTDADSAPSPAPPGGATFFS
jgi:spermidine synthase